MAVAPAARQPRPKAKRLFGSSGYLVWGSLAVFAVMATSVLIALGIGASRGGFGVAQTTTVRPAPTVVQKPQAASEFELARLNDALRALTAERERLAARVEQLERSVGDITASVNSVKDRVVAAPVNTPPEAKPAPVSAAAPIPAVAADPPERQATPPGAIAQSAPPAPVQAAAPPAIELEPAKPSSYHATRPGQIAARPSLAPKVLRPIPSPSPPAQTPPPQAAATATKGPPTQVAQIMPPANLAAANSGTIKTEFAIDLGGDMSIDGLRARWANIKGNHGAALDGLRPLVSVREGAKPGTVELRLIAGPVANAGDAAKVCASLQTKGVACRTTEFDGQKLSLR